jgi:5'-nucleotidase
MDFRAAGAVTAAIVRAFGRDAIAPGTLLNVNIPALPIERIRGVRITRQDLRAPVDFFRKTVLAEGLTEYRPGWKHLEPDREGTDIWAVRNGYVSVSVFGIDQSAAAPPAASLRLRRLERLSLQ